MDLQNSIWKKFLSYNLKSLNGRLDNFEIGRFICACLVVTFHIGLFEVGMNNWFFVNASIYTTLPVPFFAFLTGYFLATSLKSRFLKFLPILLFYYVLNIILGILILKLNNLESYYSIRDLFLIGGKNWWYIWALPIVYLVAPLINFVIQTYEKKLTLITFLFLFSIVFAFWRDNDLLLYVILVKQTINLVLVYGFGAWWRLHGHIIKYKKVLVFLSVLCLLTLQLLNNIFFMNGSKLLTTNTMEPYVVLAAFSFFIIISNIKIKNRKIYNFAGKMALPIYLFHYLFEGWIYQKLIINFNIPSSSLQLFVASILIILATVIASAIVVEINILLSWMRSLILLRWENKRKNRTAENSYK